MAANASRQAIWPFSTISPHLKTGKLKAIAITAPGRSNLAPNVPSYHEAGLKDMSITSWQAVMAPAGTPKTTLEVLNAAINNAIQSPEVVERIKHAGAIPMGGSSENAEKFIRKETELWRSIARQVNFQPGSM